MNPKFDNLTLIRTQPVQGQPVHVNVLWNGAKCGDLVLPFSAWLKLKRLLEKGKDMDARENNALGLNLSVRGVQEDREAIATTATVDEEDEDLKAVEVAEALYTPAPVASQVTPGAIRSLRGGSDD